VAKQRITVAIAQVEQSKNLAENLATAQEAVVQAHKARAEMILFPECALTGYGPALHNSTETFASARAVENALKQMRAIAREEQMAIIIGSHLPLGDGWTNSAVLISRSGRITGRYDKAHLYGRDIEYYRAGRARPAPASAHGVKVGLQICFDIRFPEPFRALALAGAQIIVVPSYIHGAKNMWKGPIVTAHAASRAAENGRFLLFANAPGRTQNVSSLIASPRGDIIARARRGARQLLTARLDLTEVNDDFLSARRRDLYPA